MNRHPDSERHPGSGGPWALVAEFETPDAVLAAAHHARDTGFRDLEAYAPFLVEGLPEAIGFRERTVPRTVLIGGLVGAATGFGMQCYSAMVSYPLNVGGRPNFSWPAFIPITFELTILFAALAGFLAVFVLNGLPRPHHPIFNTPHFTERNTTHYYLCIKSTDIHYPTAANFLRDQTPTNLWEVES